MPGLKVVNIEDLPEEHVVRPQMRDGNRAAVRIRNIDRNDRHTIHYTRYDPNLVVERHGHKGLNIIYIIDGEIMVDDRPAYAGSTIVIEPETPFGPMFVGSEGATIIESFFGANAVGIMGQDPVGFKKVTAELGITVLPEDDPNTPPARLQ